MGGEGRGSSPRPPSSLPGGPSPAPCPPRQLGRQSTGPRRWPRLELSRGQGRWALGWGLGGCRLWGAAHLPASRRCGSHPSLEASSGWKVARVPGPPPPT